MVTAKVDRIENRENRQSILTESSLRNKYAKRVELNHQNNLHSDYTEKIQELDRNFDYDKDRNCYWSDPQMSMFYGSPLYEVVSAEQKLALNHLYWIGVYYSTASNETDTILYNQITASVLFSLGYEALCYELDVETTQERHHIHAFHTVCGQTESVLLGEPIIRSTLQRVYSNHGILGRIPARQLMLQFFAANWGTSPFLASQYYTIRYIANMLLKNKESHYARYFKELERRGEYIPTPTAISRYHFLDEAFHTTTSQFLSQDLYKDLPAPTAYERFMLNTMIYLLQRNALGGLSGVFPGGFAGDKFGLVSAVYRLLQSSLFNMSAEEALEWMEKIFCQEHEGFHISQQFHQRALTDLRSVVANNEYLSAANREMRSMAEAGSIEKALANNTKAFRQFLKTVSR